MIHSERIAQVCARLGWAFIALALLTAVLGFFVLGGPQ